jgi:hypothetical protein
VSTGNYNSSVLLAKTLLSQHKDFLFSKLSFYDIWQLSLS